eukprot:Gb_36500 [translate_table: standard]
MLLQLLGLPAVGDCQVISNIDSEGGREWGDVMEVGLQCAVLCGRWKREREALSVNMGGDPVTTEPTVLKVDEDVRSILEDAGLLAFFRNFFGFMLVTEVSRLPNEGEVITRDKTNQGGQLIKFIRDDETFCWLDSGIARESLPKPWDRVAIQIMKYLTLEGKFRKLFSYHIAILNSMRNKEKVTIPLFLLKSMEKSVRAVKVGKGKAPFHQGLMKLLVDFENDKRGDVAGPSKGGFSRRSGTPVSKAQLLLGPASLSLVLKSRDTVSDSEEDSLSQEGDAPVAGSKDGGSKKRKPLSQVLNANLAKCSRRSIRLQKNSLKVAEADPVEKGPAKGLDGTQTLTEELRCHLKVLNGLGGSLSSTCACRNLLTLEITNYLKEVVKNLKDLSAAKEQQNPAGK